eukprot:13689594-Alexandrium_andersonii.AAC.1
MSQTFPAKRRYGVSPVSAVRRSQYPSTASARWSSISTNHAVCRRGRHRPRRRATVSYTHLRAHETSAHL